MEIFGLVGPSGTGKSHRASFVAHHLGIDTILDDGLLIQGARIVAGRSAKREATRLGAVRRAVLSDPRHAAELQAALARLSPRRLLVLGTSPSMIDTILERLGLGEAGWEPIPIESIATPEEIRTARNVRRRFGKHVIPAPTFEVRKSFAGYLVDPLRFIFRQRGRRVLVEKSVVRPTFSSLGRFYIAEEVLVAIAGQAAAPRVERIGYVTVRARPEGVSLTLEVVPRPEGRGPAWLLRALEEVQRRVAEAVEASTGLVVLAVDVRARRLGCPGCEADRGGKTRDGG